MGNASLDVCDMRESTDYTSFFRGRKQHLWSLSAVFSWGDASKGHRRTLKSSLNVTRKSAGWNKRAVSHMYKLEDSERLTSSRLQQD